jgi:methylenetetrahydrofolate reductase (NADH)
VEDASDQPEAAYQLALDLARHALALPGVRGLHLTDFRHDDAVSRLVTDLGIRPVEERHAHHSSLAV